MDRIQCTFFNILLLSMTISLSFSAMYISEEKPSNYEDYQKEMDKYVNESKDLQNFTPREVDPVDVTSGKDSHCEWVSKVEKPYIMINGSQIKFLIVQTDTYEQKIRTTRCINKGKPCAENIGLEKLNMTAECTQKYETRSFQVYDMQQQYIRIYYAKVPVCCLCGVIESEHT